MRYFFRIGIYGFAVVSVIAAAIVMLPCATHRIHIINTLEEPIFAQILSRDAAIWSGKLGPGEFIDLPIISDIGEGDLSLKATSSTGRTLGGGGFYIEGFPHDRWIYAFIIGQDTIYRTYIERPFISEFRSEPWRGLASVSVLFGDILSCLDCSEARQRLIR